MGLVVYTVPALHAQELNAKVTIITSRITTQVDRRIFNTLQTQLINLLNNRKWTEDNFKQQEKIDCNFILNLDRQVETNVFSASLIIQAARPIFNTNYNSPIINWQDNDVVFRYVEFQPVEFNESRLSGTDALNINLPAIFAFYANLIVGLDYNSFAIKGGDPYFKRALFIVNNAPSTRNVSGWSQFDGLRNRFWLAENLMNNRYTLIHDAIYQYYRNSLDYFYEDEQRARDEMMNVLNLLNSFNTSNQNTAILQFFMQSKANEIIEIFRRATPDQKQRAVAILEKIDVTNAKRYREALK
ncbi:MAG TPA: DUF4835 family protein [Phnomibacter sp.]|nr:DUF4835 family protein [Phnomibacter sp.]